MARTTQSAPKSTSSSAPRKHALDLSSSPNIAKRRQNSPDSGDNVPKARQLAIGLPWSATEEQSPASDFCHICINGGRLLVECDSCGCTYCSVCIEFKLTANKFENVYFFCHGCHEIEERKGKGKPRPYVGLYKKAYDEEGRLVRGPPLRPGKSLRIVGLPAGVPTRRVVATPLALIHLHLSSCVTTSTDFCSSIVKPYFQSKQLTGMLSIHDVEFDLSVEGGYQTYQAAIQQVADSLKNLAPMVQGRRALIMVSTHSDENRGDLFLASDGAYSHQDFFSTILPPAFAEALAGFETTFMFMVCGAFVSIPQSLIDLKGMIAKYRLANVITFTSRLLQPDLVKPFLLHLLLQKYVHGYRLSKTILRILSEAPHDFRRHTGIIHLGYSGNLDNDPSTPSVFATHYMWHSHTIMPWGVQIPVQCPECMCIRPWKFPSHVPGMNQNVVVKCKGWVGIEEDSEVGPSGVSGEVTKKRGRRKAKAATSEDQEGESHPPPRRCTYTITCNPPSRPFSFVPLPAPHVEGRWIVAVG
ncbi:hypothetical protein EVG20_g10909 [Dentipellis fragilis]|uniref:Uncharacterized protein n=1 Tax=Dentipellis fragilis TaxID=205917 RepID=A0A4Y9XPF5_9AGAM|nr:hypothetical protein EVG20_g10909 [Dentipellis fragilis]